MGILDALTLLVKRHQSLYQAGSHHQLWGRLVFLCTVCHLLPPVVPPAHSEVMPGRQRKAGEGRMGLVSSETLKIPSGEAAKIKDRF